MLENTYANLDRVWINARLKSELGAKIKFKQQNHQPPNDKVQTQQ